MSITHIAFYPSDWLAGTRGMSDAETGVYITLISKMYEMAGPIERDDNRLYRLCGCKSKASFVKSLNFLMDDGKILEKNGEFYNERVQKEIKITTEKSQKAQQAAESRWARKSNKIKGTENADASLEHMPQPCQPEPESEPDIKKGEAKASLSLAKQNDDQDDVRKAMDIFKAAAKEHGWGIPAILTKARRSKLSARLKECNGIDGWNDAISKAKSSSHCNGDNDRGWTINFDFIITQASFVKLMEGNYDDRPKTNGHSRTGNSAGSSITGGFLDGLIQSANTVPE